MSTLNFEPGQTISHFRIEKLLGEGGMGAVYLAEDLTLSRRVAIKFMHRHILVQETNQAGREGLEKRFIREAKSAAAINHPNLAQIYEANFESENWFIAMEYIDGSSLYDLLLDGKKFSVKEIINICRQVVSGLDFAWENYKIVHRDIKPHNIMLTKNQLVKIVDLGLAKPLVSEETEFEMPDLTSVGTPIGTPQYMAPEQATGQKDITCLVDIFSLGATLYEVFTGNKAFTGNTAPMIYMAQVQKKYISLDQVKKGVPKQFVNLVHSMLEPKPEERISSYQKILDTLNEIDLDPASLRPRSAVIQRENRPLSSIQDQWSSKTVGMDPLSVYHPADMLIKNRYRILKLIGKGKAGIVYHCMDTQLGVECAVKSIFPGREYPEHEMPRIAANFQRLMSLSHPNLVQIRDLQLDEDTGEFFVVMELLIGGNLREFTHKLRNKVNELNIITIRPVLVLIAKALDSVSETFSLVHQDLIPEKIYILENETQVKLLDYGITTPSSEDEETLKQEEFYRLPLATPDYLSPEQWQRKPLSRQSDQYSFAVIIYEMLSEKLPFWLKDQMNADDISEGEKDGNTKLLLHEKQLQNLYTRVLNEPPNPLPSLKRHENEAILKALAKDSHKRFPGCEDFINALAKSTAIPGWVKISAFSAAAVIVILAIALPTIHKQKRLKIQTFEKTEYCKSKRQELIQSSISPSLLDQFDAKMEEADKRASQKDYKQAIRLYDDVIDIGKRITEQIGQWKLKTSKLKTSCEGLREKLSKNSALLPQLNQFDAKTTMADKSFSSGDYETSMHQFKEASQFAEKILERVAKIDQVKAKLKTLQKDVDKVRNTYSEDRVAAELLNQFDQALKDGDTGYNQTNFKVALTHYENAITKGERILTIELKPPTDQELKTFAAKLQTSFQLLHKEFAKKPHLAPRLSELDGMAKEASNLFESKIFSQAIKEYEKAISWMDEVKQQMEEASNYKELINEIKQEFLKDDDLNTHLAKLDDHLKRGNELFEKGDFAQANIEYKNGADSARNFEDTLKQQRKEIALAKKQEANKLRAQLKRYKKITPEVTEKIVKIDVKLSLARESLKKEDFKEAIEHYHKAIVDSTALLNLAQGKFQATKGNDFTDPKTGMEFVWIKSLDSWVGKYEVTNQEYRKFKSTHDSKKSMGFSLNKNRQPVIEVTYYDAVGFCEYMNAVSLEQIKAPSGYVYRLPTREEWEAVARCGTERLYPWGNDWPPLYGNFGNQEVFPSTWQLDGFSDECPVTCAVEKSGKNEWGIFGLAGNVWEWTSHLQNGKRAVLGGDWTSINRATLIVSVQGAVAQMDEPFDNIGFRVLLAPESK